MRRKNKNSLQLTIQDAICYMTDILFDQNASTFCRRRARTTRDTLLLVKDHITELENDLTFQEWELKDADVALKEAQTAWEEERAAHQETRAELEKLKKDSNSWSGLKFPEGYARGGYVFPSSQVYTIYPRGGSARSV